MRSKIIYIIPLLVLALVASGCVTKASEETQPTPRTLSVSGWAKVYLTPDIATITIGVHTENADPKEAVASNNAQAQAIKEAIMALGVAEEDIQTTNFSIYPSQQYGPDGKLTGTTYIVDNSVTVTVRDLSKISDILGAAVAAGANTINGIQFDVSDKEAAVSQARTEAVQNAQKTAEELATAAGVTLGEIQSLSYYGGYPILVMEGKGGGAAVAAPSAVPVSPGQLTITADVNVVYEIK